MLEKTFKNEELGIEIKSYIDKQQNIWFRGKDVAQILGFKDSVNALKRHVSLENKMIQLSRSTSVGGAKTTPQQSKSDWGGVSPPQQNDKILYKIL